MQNSVMNELSLLGNSKFHQFYQLKKSVFMIKWLGEQLPKISKWKLRNTLWDQTLPALADG